MVVDFGQRYACVEQLRPGARFAKVPTLFGRISGDSFLCIFKAKASRSTRLGTYFNFYSLYNIWKDQPYRISAGQFYEWLFGPEKSSGLSRNGPRVFKLILLARERILNNINVVCEDKLNRERALFSGCRRGFEKVACLISQTYNKLVIICNKKSACDVFCCIITGFACFFWLTTCYRHGHNLVVLKSSKAARESKFIVSDIGSVQAWDRSRPSVSVRPRWQPKP